MRKMSGPQHGCKFFRDLSATRMMKVKGKREWEEGKMREGMRMRK